jgi:hypothetical protein
MLSTAKASRGLSAATVTFPALLPCLFELTTFRADYNIAGLSLGLFHDYIRGTSFAEGLLYVLNRLLGDFLNIRRG